MANSSIVPPLRSNSGKYGLAGVLLLAGVLGLWFFVGRGTSSPAVPEPVTQTTPTRGQFAPALQLPIDMDASVVEEEEEPEEPARRQRAREVVCRGKLKPADIRRVINSAAQGQVRTCYERRLKENNTLQGSMNLLLTIGPSGEVATASVSGSLRDQKIYSCVRNIAQSWEFPKPTGGCVQTSVPFTMTPKL